MFNENIKFEQNNLGKNKNPLPTQPSALAASETIHLYHNHLLIIFKIHNRLDKYKISSSLDHLKSVLS